MSPGIALVLVGSGFALVYVATRPGGLSGLLGLDVGAQTGAGGQTLTEAQRQALANPQTFSGQFGGTSGAFTGAAVGSSFGPWGTAIGAGVGAVYGLIQHFGGNTTKDAREKFAESLGFYQLGQEKSAERSTVTSWSGRESLYGYLNFYSEQTGDVRGWELVHVGLNVIGRNDAEGNQQWMYNVVTLLDSIGFFRG